MQRKIRHCILQPTLSHEQTDRRALLSSLRILALVHGENFKGGSKTARLVYEEFYIPEIAEKIDIRNDYLNWMNNKLRPALRTGVSECAVMN